MFWYTDTDVGVIGTATLRMRFDRMQRSTTAQHSRNQIVVFENFGVL